MKKFLVVLLVVFSVSLISCPGPHDPVVQLTFEEAVQEVYDIVGATLFYSSNGITMDKDVVNRVTGPNEIPGVCTDYSIEFAYYWNEVKNYDELYGKAYITTSSPDNTSFQIRDFIFKPNGTSKIRETSGNFGINGNDQEADGVYRDIIYTSIIYNKRNIEHFGIHISRHMWVVININDEWYDTEPTWRDTSMWDQRSNNYAPVKIIF